MDATFKKKKKEREQTEKKEKLTIFNPVYVFACFFSLPFEPW